MKIINFIILMLMVPFTLVFAADVPVYEAEIGPPVSKLEGGYVDDYVNLNRRLSWHTSADRGNAQNAVDYRYTSCWKAEKGSILNYYFPVATINYDNIRGVYVISWTGIRILNGDGSAPDKWKKSGRVSRMKVYVNGIEEFHIKLIDTDRWQKVEFPVINFISPNDNLEFEVTDIYGGKKEACLTEFMLLGGHPRK